MGISRCSCLVVFMFLWMCGTSLSLAMKGTGLEFDKRLNGKDVLKSVEPLRRMLDEASIAFFNGRKLICYGVVMGESFVLTKASLVTDRSGMFVRYGDRIDDRLEWGGVDQVHDLVLIKIPRQKFRLPVFERNIPDVGTFVVSNGSTTRTRRRAKLGIISGKEHPVPYPNAILPYMGLVFNKPCSIASVEKRSPAERAGLRPGDVIQSIDGRAIENLQEIGLFLENKKPGDMMTMGVQRRKKVLSYRFHLGNRRDYLGDEPKDEENLEMSGRTSDRKYGFPSVIQHDTPVLPSFMGGPLLNLEGKIIGVNIARANRAETYALPMKDVLELYGKLVSDFELNLSVDSKGEGTGEKKDSRSTIQER